MRGNQDREKCCSAHFELLPYVILTPDLARTPNSWSQWPPSSVGNDRAIPLDAFGHDKSKVFQVAIRTIKALTACSRTSPQMLRSTRRLVAIRRRKIAMEPLKMKPRTDHFTIDPQQLTKAKFKTDRQDTTKAKKVSRSGGDSCRSMGCSMLESDAVHACSDIRFPPS